MAGAAWGGGVGVRGVGAGAGAGVRGWVCAKAGAAASSIAASTIENESFIKGLDCIAMVIDETKPAIR